MSARVPVDETDFRIVREVFHGEAESFRSDRVPIDEIAKRLGLHRNTVSARIRRLTEHRVLLPASLEVEPAQFGLVAALAFMDVPRERRDEALKEALFALGGVQTLFQFVEGWELILYATTDEELFAKIERARQLSGASRVRLDTLSSRDYPPVEPLRITPLDARIMLALLGDARGSFSAVADALGVTTMTVKRRYERLVRAGALYIFPSGDCFVEGMVMGFVAVDVPHERDLERVDEELLRLAPNRWIRNVAVRGRILLIIYARSIEELEMQVRDARRIQGVAGVDLRIFTGICFNPGYRAWISRVIERRGGLAGEGAGVTGEQAL